MIHEFLCLVSMLLVPSGGALDHISVRSIDELTPTNDANARGRRRTTEDGSSTSDSPAVVISFDETAVDCVNDVEKLYKGDSGESLEEAEENFLNFFVEHCKDEQDEHQEGGNNKTAVLCSFPQPAVSSTTDYQFVTDVEIDLRRLKGVSPEYDELPLLCSSSAFSYEGNTSSTPTFANLTSAEFSFCTVDTFLYVDNDGDSQTPRQQQHYYGIPLCVAIDQCSPSGDASLNNDMLQKAFANTCVHLWGMGKESGDIQCSEMAKNAAFHCGRSASSPIASSSCNDDNELLGAQSSRLDTSSGVNEVLPLPSNEYTLGLEKLSRKIQEDCFGTSTSESGYCHINNRQLPDYRFVLDFFSIGYITQKKTEEKEGEDSIVEKASELLDELSDKCEEADGYLCRSDLQFEYDILKFPAHLRGKITIRGYPICFPSDSEECNGEDHNQAGEDALEKLELRRDIARDVMVWEFVAQLADQLDLRRTRRRRNTRLANKDSHLRQQYTDRRRERRRRELQSDVYDDFEWRTVKDILPKLPGLNGEDAKKNGGVSAVDRWGPGLCGGNSFDCQATITKFMCSAR